jgi:hypothetical protein
MESGVDGEYYHALAWFMYTPISDASVLMLAQYGSPFSDGTPAASQWTIPPGKYFDYEFMFDDDLSGTL